MTKYRKRPVVIEAFQINEAWLNINTNFLLGKRMIRCNKDHAIIPTLEGDMKAYVGDWIIKGVEDEVYPCKPTIFEKTYEKV